MTCNFKIMVVTFLYMGQFLLLGIIKDVDMSEQITLVILFIICYLFIF
jgi:hypothetical protein